MTEPEGDWLEKAADAFATKDHVDNDLGIATRYPNSRFTFISGARAMEKRKDEEIGKLKERVEEESQAYVDMMELRDAEIRKVAKLQVELEHTQRQLADAMSGCCDCPMFKEVSANRNKLGVENQNLRAEVAIARERLGPAGYKILEETKRLRNRVEALERVLQWIGGSHDSQHGEDYTDLEFEMVTRASNALLDDALKEGG